MQGILLQQNKKKLMNIELYKYIQECNETVKPVLVLIHKRSNSYLGLAQLAAVCAEMHWVIDLNLSGAQTVPAPTSPGYCLLMPCMGIPCGRGPG